MFKIVDHQVCTLESDSNPLILSEIVDFLALSWKNDHLPPFYSICLFLAFRVQHMYCASCWFNRTNKKTRNYCFCVIFNLPSTSRVSWFWTDCIGCSVTEDSETGFTPFRKKPCDWTLLFARKLPFKMLELQSYFMTAVLLLIGFLLLHHFYPYCFIL